MNSQWSTKLITKQECPLIQSWYSPNITNTRANDLQYMFIIHFHLVFLAPVSPSYMTQVFKMKCIVDVFIWQKFDSWNSLKLACLTIFCIFCLYILLKLIWTSKQFYRLKILHQCKNTYLGKILIVCRQKKGKLFFVLFRTKINKNIYSINKNEQKVKN